MKHKRQAIYMFCHRCHVTTRWALDNDDEYYVCMGDKHNLLKHVPGCGRKLAWNYGHLKFVDEDDQE